MRKEIVCKKCITCMFRTIVSRCEVAAKRRTHKTWILPRQRKRWKVDVEVVIWTWHRQRRTGTALHIHAHTRARLLVYSFGSVRFRDSIPQYSDCCLIFSCLATFCLYHRRVFLSKFHPFSCISPTSAEARSNFSATCILFRSEHSLLVMLIQGAQKWNEMKRKTKTEQVRSTHSLTPTHVTAAFKWCWSRKKDQFSVRYFQCSLRQQLTASAHTHTQNDLLFVCFYQKNVIERNQIFGAFPLFHPV